MKKLIIVLLLPLVIFACQKEEMKIDYADDVFASLELKNDGYRSEESRCFYFIFPVSLNMPDGTVVSGDTREELNKAAKNWFRENGRGKKKDISLHFPVGVNFKGKVIRLQNERQLERIRKACSGDKEGDKDRDRDRDRDRDKDKTPCIGMLFPVSYSLPSGRSFTANNGKELREMMAKWKENNPDAKERPKLVYPVDVKFKGRKLTVNNEKEMMRIRKACNGDKEVDKDKKACFKLVYPLTYKMPDGTLITRDSKKEMDQAIKRWYTANKSDKKPQLQFPIQIKYVTDLGDKIVDIENQRVLKKAYEDCDN